MNVGRESRLRAQHDTEAEGLLVRGVMARYGVSASDVREAACAAGLLHDLGKLQLSWQRWAEAAQLSADASYVHSAPLAHTDFNREEPADVERERQLRAAGVKRPHHAAASCYYGRSIIITALQAASASRRPLLASAVAAAILSHHGGWWRHTEFEPPVMCPGWEGEIEGVVGSSPNPEQVHKLSPEVVDQLLSLTTGPDSLREHWPLVSYLMRTLRLADQRATAEAGADE